MIKVILIDRYRESRICVAWLNTVLALESMPKQLAEMQTKLENVEYQLETAKTEVAKPFAQEAELAQKLERLSALNALLNMDEKGDVGIKNAAKVNVR